MQHAVCLLASGLSKPTEYDFEALVCYGRYLVGCENMGVWLSKVDPRTYPRVVVRLHGYADSGFAACKLSRMLLSSQVVFADGCQLFSRVKRQSLVRTSICMVEFYALTNMVIETKPIKVNLRMGRIQG